MDNSTLHMCSGAARMISQFPNVPTAFLPLCFSLFLTPCWNVLFHEATFQVLHLAFKVQLEELPLRSLPGCVGSGGTPSSEFIQHCG